MTLTGHAAQGPRRGPDALLHPATSAAPTLRVVLIRIIRSSPLLLLALLAGAGLGYGLLRVVPVKYTSSVEILIDPKKPNTYGAASAFENIYVDNTKISSLELILISSELLQQVVRNEHLADLPEYGDPVPSLTDRLLTFFGSPPPAEPDTQEAREGRAIEQLIRAIKSQRLGMTYVIRVDVSAGNADLAQRLAAAVADTYLSYQLQIKYAATARDVNWLSKQVEQLRTELIQSEDRVEVHPAEIPAHRNGSRPGFHRRPADHNRGERAAHPGRRRGGGTAIAVRAGRTPAQNRRRFAGTSGSGGIACSSGHCASRKQRPAAPSPASALATFPPTPALRRPWPTARRSNARLLPRSRALSMACATKPRPPSRGVTRCATSSPG